MERQHGKPISKGERHVSQWQDGALGLIFDLIFAAGTFASQRIASAADPAFCSKYASDANKAATQAKQLKCGFQGPRWAKDLGGHTAWCLFVDQSLAQSETDTRAKDLKDCTCHWYADQTMVQIAMNIANKCGFTGLRWLDDKQAHFDWCDKMNPSFDAMKSEIKARDKALKGC